MENKTDSASPSTTLTEIMTPESMLEEANENFTTAFMEFNECLASPTRSSYYCFVEGYDMDYYECVVSHILSSDNEFISCHCKKNVIRMHAKLSANGSYSNVKTLYFVDKDYDDNSILAKDIFVTDHYSIENYYCSENMLTKVLQKLYHINIRKEPERYERVLIDFRKWHTDFFNVTRPFCAWYKTARTRNVPKKKAKHYKESFPTILANITRDGIEMANPPYDLTLLNSEYTPTPCVSQQEYDKNIVTITSTRDIRGKYVLQFIEAYLSHLDNSWKGIDALIESSVGTQSNRTTFMSRFASFADTSNNLRDYINSRK